MSYNEIEYWSKSEQVWNCECELPVLRRMKISDYVIQNIELIKKKRHEFAHAILPETLTITPVQKIL